LLNIDIAKQSPNLKNAHYWYDVERSVANADAIKDKSWSTKNPF